MKSQGWLIEAGSYSVRLTYLVNYGGPGLAGQSWYIGDGGFGPVAESNLFVCHLELSWRGNSFSLQYN
jgi:hypothetical protein